MKYKTLMQSQSKLSIARTQVLQMFRHRMLARDQRRERVGNKCVNATMSNRTVTKVEGEHSAFRTAFAEVLLLERKVKVPGVGIFEVVKCKGNGTRVLAGKTVVVEDYQKIRFRPTLKLKKAVNGK